MGFANVVYITNDLPDASESVVVVVVDTESYSFYSICIQKIETDCFLFVIMRLAQQMATDTREVDMHTFSPKTRLAFSWRYY